MLGFKNSTIVKYRQIKQKNLTGTINLLKKTREEDALSATKYLAKCYACSEKFLCNDGFSATHICQIKKILYTKFLVNDFCDIPMCHIF